jgi:hypothetical protein
MDSKETTSPRKLCVYCGKQLKPPKKKYCNKDCMGRFLREGPAVERWKYEENPEPNLEELEELTKKGAWLLFPATQEDQQCIGDFLRTFHHPPEHVSWLPTSPLWKYTGPVWEEEELAHRWRGWQEAQEKEERKARRKRYAK